MRRLAYRTLVRLHPAAFRRDFAGEMLWIFDEMSSYGSVRLFTDCFVSLVRQWLIRQGIWKAIAAATGAFLYISFAFQVASYR